MDRISKKSSALGEFPTVFQSELIALIRCSSKIKSDGTMRKKIGIFTDSQAAMKALLKDFIYSKIVLECINSLNEISNCNELLIKWVPED